MLKKITFEIETITPMFLAGADQSKAELRAASIKGLLRFWWRALQAESDLEKLRQKEAQIFGSSEEGIGGSSFGIRLSNTENIQPINARLPNNNQIHTVTFRSQRQDRHITINILEYLAYGPYNPQGRQLRPYIPANKKFNLIFSFNKDQYLSETLDAMYIFSLFGGLGSRSRNGFGSFFVTNFHETFKHLSNSPINNLYDKESIKASFKNSGLHSYPAFVNKTRVFKSKVAHQTWDIALSEVGKLYRSIRVGEQKLNNVAFENKHSYNKRQYLGAPLDPYREPFKSFLDRHAKPYFIKVAKEGDKYRSYILYLPSKYCDGLEKDRNKRIINHSSEDKKFSEVCNEFNSFLADNMETVI
jgi:CRISPR-associated protein Cmr1